MANAASITQRTGPSRLNAQLGVPLYRQIQVILRNSIHNGELPPGASVPSEQELCVEYGVSRITAKRALNELADTGLVTRQRGRGTRVVERPPAPTIRSSIEGWLENVSMMGQATSAAVRDFAYVPAGEEIATALAIAPGEIVQRAVRVRRFRDQPFSYLVTYVPETIGRQYEREDMERLPLLQLLERAGITIASARQSISATIADAETANALAVDAGAPLLEVRRVVRDDADRPVEYIRVLYRPDLYRFDMSMRRVRSADGMTWSAERDEDLYGIEETGDQPATRSHG